ncbi:DUF3127 domain-containing protein [Brumimicrobium aurantiacum]|uniref:DUF3127 domain-containing protein n=1 Tax=Brumimicrobium aurantiacum TaxID=1737063 RepID=A0A3E1EW24_9FLAO|nr:DUF3127 domain-containing protein [Brumimicrobium aurantiacum]RFC53722.1 DUF3127 domain-containing protein [Brumimicrobium aurantiacum]
MFSISGIVKVKKDTEQITEKFKKREFVVTDQSGNYPQDILFQLTQDRTDLLEGINVNDVVNVTFNIRGREWTNPQGEVKYFNSLDVWRLEKNQGGGAPTPADIAPASSDSAETLVDEGDDDLPF